MARRRKVGNLLALAVLATVVAEPMHPYEMARLMRERGKDEDMPIKWGSLYTVVANLEKHGLLEVAGNERSGARPERTTYRITDAGRAELVDWVRELLGEPEVEHPRFRAGLSVAGVLPPDEVIELLRQRLVTLDAAAIERERALQAYASNVPRLFLIEAEYDLAMRRAEIAWVRGLVAELADGSLPGLGQWRDYHVETPILQGDSTPSRQERENGERS